MVVTRSSDRPRQGHNEDFPAPKDPHEVHQKATARNRASKDLASKTPEPKAASKRKAPPPTSKSQRPEKKPKSQSATAPKQIHPSSQGTSQIEKLIIINRSPVLHLWSAVVASLVHPDLSWQACLNIGSAISTLCAVSKGKAIGMMATPDRTEEAETHHKDKRRREKDETGANQVEVMGFKLPLKSDSVILSGKPTKVKEVNLIAKYGGEEVYNKVKETMTSGGQTWEDKLDDFNEQAFKMYENFRPAVPKGEKGWGRRGELDLAELYNIVGG